MAELALQFDRLSFVAAMPESCPQGTHPCSVAPGPHNDLMPTQDGPTRVVIVAGAGSSAEFVQRSFPAMPGIADEVIAIAEHGGSQGVVADCLGEQVVRAREQRVRIILGGISFGAHASAAYVLSAPRQALPDGLACVMPAWTGEPGPVAAATLATAHRLRVQGVGAVLAELTAAFGSDWVVEELARAWQQRHAGSLAAELSAVAACPSPTLARLRQIGLPTAVVALRGDPMHPAEVATAWASAIPGASLVALDREDLAADRALLGQAALRSLQRPASASR